MTDEIHTARLILRQWRDSDRDPFAAMGADHEVMRYFPTPVSREASDALIDREIGRIAESGFGLWAVDRRDTDAFIGFTGVAPMPPDVPGAGGTEIGWRLAAAHWGQGFATEAALAVLARAFDESDATPRFTELYSMTAVTNVPSQRVMRRIGMRHFDDFDHPRVPIETGLRPHVVFRITADEYRRQLGDR